MVQQLACGVDVGNDGEQSRESFFTYVRHRMSGFGGQAQRPLMRDLALHPGFLELMLPHYTRGSVSLLTAPKAIGAVRYQNRAPLDADLARFAAVAAAQPQRFAEIVLDGAVARHRGVRDAERALRVARGVRGRRRRGAAHRIRGRRRRGSRTADRRAGSRDGAPHALRRPPGAASSSTSSTPPSRRSIAHWRTIPPERVRLHVCWGNYEGPHTCDVPLASLLPHLVPARVGALVLSMANPRHAHEHRVLARQALPASWLLIAGVIDTTTNYVEHPEVVAERIERAARAIGDPHRVLAGTDCGFDTAAGMGQVADDVVWEKLRALRAGAELASQRLL